MRVTVVGAGIIGLTAALRCAEAGHDVAVLARDLPLETTSAVAGGLWYPYRALPQDRVTAWARIGYAELAALAESDPTAGVDVRQGVELLRRPAGDPWWAGALPPEAGLQRLGAGQVPPGYAAGWRLVVPVVDLGVHLPWLRDRVEAAGATVTRAWLSQLPEPRNGHVVVNATGLSARALVGDGTVVPVRGQVVRVARPRGLSDFLLDDAEPSRPLYVVPRRADVVVGGTAEEGEWDLRPEPATTERLLARAAALVPELAGARVLGARAGLRPVRPEVRLEVEPAAAGGATVHCYGHGGAGVTLAWGCAAEVAALVAAAVEG